VPLIEEVSSLIQVRCNLTLAHDMVCMSGLLSLRDLTVVRGFDPKVHFLMFKALEKSSLGTLS